jgi:hypothetical protein
MQVVDHENSRGFCTQLVDQVEQRFGGGLSAVRPAQNAAHSGSPRVGGAHANAERLQQRQQREGLPQLFSDPQNNEQPAVAAGSKPARRRADLPMPGSPSTSTAAPWPALRLPSQPARRASSSTRPASGWPPAPACSRSGTRAALTNVSLATLLNNSDAAE